MTDTKNNGNKKNGHKPVGAVMIVGGGISGMQSAIDLVESGYKVYMVEETTAIGGLDAPAAKKIPPKNSARGPFFPQTTPGGPGPQIYPPPNTPGPNHTRTGEKLPSQDSETARTHLGEK